MKLEPRVSIVTIGVDDLDRATRFYESMGLERNKRITEGVSFFQMGGIILALWPRGEMARDVAGDDGVATRSGKERASASGPGVPDIVLAYNTRAEADVALILKAAEKAGGRMVRPAARAFWGGVQGYFADTEGNLWEVAHNPAFPIDAEGRIRLPE
ncbi:VOC family protein [Chelativorans sp. Marseille-P2723]|uniref:VOC family protein n=1 Tax=Chelativorans sp. Marseille-P2723 TaxID=2709133 RepID=UPI00156FA401|nr:VOC family protein [Chelativorans sp. Marseille-P2723]